MKGKRIHFKMRNFDKSLRIIYLMMEQKRMVSNVHQSYKLGGIAAMNNRTLARLL